MTEQDGTPRGQGGLCFQLPSGGQQPSYEYDQGRTVQSAKFRHICARTIHADDHLTRRLDRRLRIDARPWRRSRAHAVFFRGLPNPTPQAIAKRATCALRRVLVGGQIPPGA